MQLFSATINVNILKNPIVLPLKNEKKKFPQDQKMLIIGPTRPGKSSQNLNFCCIKIAHLATYA